MGPYYLTALISLIGPIRFASGSARVTHDQRTITSQPLFGTKIEVETPTHIAGVLEFQSGAVATLVTSFDVQAHQLPHIEIYGTRGTLSLPDPNQFGGPVQIWDNPEDGWQEVGLTHAYSANSRGLGVADMAYALRAGHRHRANGELAYHVLDTMHAILDAAATGSRIELQSTCQRPAALSPGRAPGRFHQED
jgi:predicted dehydrogenase